MFAKETAEIKPESSTSTQRLSRHSYYLLSEPWRRMKSRNQTWTFWVALPGLREELVPTLGLLGSYGKKLFFPPYFLNCRLHTGSMGWECRKGRGLSLSVSLIPTLCSHLVSFVPWGKMGRYHNTCQPRLADTSQGQPASPAQSGLARADC